MQVLVTGGSGAIGRFVVDGLRASGHDVTVFDIEPPKGDGGDYVNGDITDEDDVQRAVEQEDVVVHLAALLPRACRRNPRRAEAINVGGTLNVLEKAAEEDIRVIYASSKAVFGTTTGVNTHPEYQPIGEDAPKSPTSIYGVTKATVEQFAADYRQDGLDAAAVRFASTYGPGKGDAHGDLAMLPNAIRRAADGKTVQLKGADQCNDLVYYRDIARGITAAVETDELQYPTYHIGSGKVFSIHEFAEALHEYTDAPINVEEGLNYRDADHPSYCQLDISRARSDLGYQPAFSIRDGVKDFLANL
jgi:nucleoside-diphosphate-sugar epimerase